MKDEIVEAVREDLLRRSKRGIQKYGVTMDRDDLSLLDWLQHTYEEVLDQANYLKKMMVMMQEVEENNKDFLCAQANAYCKCSGQCDECKRKEDETRTTD